MRLPSNGHLQAGKVRQCCNYLAGLGYFNQAGPAKIVHFKRLTSSSSSEHALLAHIASDKPSICGFFVTRDSACNMFFTKYLETSEMYNSVTCYWLDMEQSAGAAARVYVEVMPIFKLYKNGLEKDEAITTMDLHGLFAKAENLL